MISLPAFLTEWTGKGVNVPEDKNPYGFQCVELVNEWLKELGLVTIKFTNAQDFDDHYRSYDPSTLVWVPNTPTNIPKPGDIMVFQGVGLPFGHVSIFIHGDVNSFTSFDQNYPTNSLPHLQWHNYSVVEGWLHPTVLDPPVVVVDPKDALISKLEAQATSLSSQVNVLSVANSTLTAKITAIRNLVQ